VYLNDTVVKQHIKLYRACLLTATAWCTRVGCIRISNECIVGMRLKGRIIISLSGARVCNNFFWFKCREWALHSLHFTRRRRVLQPASNPRAISPAADSNRMTHNASAADAAGKRSEKGISTTMRGRAIIFSFNGRTSSECVCSVWPGCNFHSELDVGTNYAKLRIVRQIRYVPRCYRFKIPINPSTREKRIYVTTILSSQMVKTHLNVKDLLF